MNKKYKLTLLLFIIIILIGCRKNPQKPDISKKNTLPKLPKILTELEEDILKIMYDLDSVNGIEKAIEEQSIVEAKEELNILPVTHQKKEQDDNEEKKDNRDKEKDDEKDKKDTESDEEEKIDLQQLIAENEIIIPLLKATDVKGTFEKKSTPPPNIDEVWIKINNNIKEIHKKWNVLEAQLETAKVPKSKIENFEKILDNLTLSVANEKIFDSLTLSNESTKVIANFRTYFNNTVSHNVYNMYYNIRSVILFAASNNYEKAMDHLNETRKVIGFIRQDLTKKDSQNVIQKLELSIEDLEKQLTNKNLHLSLIKAPIVVKNIKLIQNMFEQQIVD